jgi:dCMP deaminase
MILPKHRAGDAAAVAAAVVADAVDCISYAMSNERLSIPQYAMALAHVASLRSEDPYRKVGAAALDHDNRVIATAYNGLAPGFDAPPGFWQEREKRQKFMLHAEVNLCSLFKRGEAKIVATTTMPCTACMQTLCAYGIKEVYYRDVYHQSDAPEIAATYGVSLIQVTDFPHFPDGVSE